MSNQNTQEPNPFAPPVKGQQHGPTVPDVAGQPQYHVFPAPGDQHPHGAHVPKSATPAGTWPSPPPAQTSPSHAPNQVSAAAPLDEPYPRVPWGAHIALYLIVLALVAVYSNVVHPMIPKDALNGLLPMAVAWFSAGALLMLGRTSLRGVPPVRQVVDYWKRKRAYDAAESRTFLQWSEAATNGPGVVFPTPAERRRTAKDFRKHSRRPKALLRWFTIPAILLVGLSIMAVPVFVPDALRTIVSAGMLLGGTLVVFLLAVNGFNSMDWGSGSAWGGGSSSGGSLDRGSDSRSDNTTHDSWDSNDSCSDSWDSCSSDD